MRRALENVLCLSMDYGMCQQDHSLNMVRSKRLNVAVWHKSLQLAVSDRELTRKCGVEKTNSLEVP